MIHIKKSYACVASLAHPFARLCPSLLPPVVAFVHGEWDEASVLLSRGFVGSSSTLCPRSRRFWVRSFWIASVEPADQHPAGFLTPGPSTAVFRVCCGTVISQSSCLSRLLFCLLSLTAPFNRDTSVSASVGPFGATRNHNPTRTAIIFVCVDSFIRLLTAKHQMLTPSLVPRSHAHGTTHSSGHSFSNPVAGWLLQQTQLSNPGGLKWSPHLLPISPTHHSDLESCTSAKLWHLY